MPAGPTSLFPPSSSSSPFFALNAKPKSQQKTHMSLKNSQHISQREKSCSWDSYKEKNPNFLRDYILYYPYVCLCDVLKYRLIMRHTWLIHPGKTCICFISKKQKKERKDSKTFFVSSTQGIDFPPT